MNCHVTYLDCPSTRDATKCKVSEKLHMIYMHIPWSHWKGDLTYLEFELIARRTRLATGQISCPERNSPWLYSILPLIGRLLSAAMQMRQVRIYDAAYELPPLQYTHSAHLLGISRACTNLGISRNCCHYVWNHLKREYSYLISKWQPAAERALHAWLFSSQCLINLALYGWIESRSLGKYSVGAWK